MVGLRHTKICKLSFWNFGAKCVINFGLGGNFGYLTFNGGKVFNYDMATVTELFTRRF